MVHNRKSNRLDYATVATAGAYPALTFIIAVRFSPCHYDPPAVTGGFCLSVLELLKKEVLFKDDLVRLIGKRPYEDTAPPTDGIPPVTETSVSE